MALFVADVRDFLDRHPELASRKGQLMAEVRLEADAGKIGSAAVRRILGDALTDQLFSETFDRRS